MIELLFQMEISMVKILLMVDILKIQRLKQKINKEINVYLGNGDVLEIRNKAVVTIGDLDNVSNIGTIEFSNDQAVTQDSTSRVE